MGIDLLVFILLYETVYKFNNLIGAIIWQLVPTMAIEYTNGLGIKGSQSSGDESVLNSIISLILNSIYLVFGPLIQQMAYHCHLVVVLAHLQRQIGDAQFMWLWLLQSLYVHTSDWMVQVVDPLVG